MEDFLFKNYFVLTHGVESLAAIAALLVYKKYKQTPAKYFIFFVIYIAFIDAIGGYTRLVQPNRILDFLVGTIFEKNHWLFNISWYFGVILFFSFYYRKVLKTKLFVGIIKWISAFYFVFSVIYFAYYFDLFFTQFFITIEVLGAFVILTCVTLYFIEILFSDRILYFYKSLNFYISFTIFIWWLITTPLSFFDVYYFYEVANPDRDWNFIVLRRQIYILVNIFMYLTFTFALIWCKPEND